MATAPQQRQPAILLSPAQKKRARREIVADSIVGGIVFALALTVIQRAVGFGRGIVFCRLMTDQQLGQWSMVWSYLMVLAPLSVLGLPGCFGKFTEHFRRRGQFKTFIVRISLISTLTTVAVSGIILTFPEIVAQILFRDASQVVLVRWLAFALIIVTASNFLCSLMESLRQIRAVTLMRFLTGIMFATIGTGFLLGWNGDASAATIGFAISCLIGLLPAIWVLWRYQSDDVNVESIPLTHSAMWTRIGPYAVWLWASNLLNNLFEVSDRFMLLQWSNTTPEQAQAIVGQYHSGRVVPLLLVSISGVLAGVLLPYMSQAWESKNRKSAIKQSNVTVKVVAISFTLCGTMALLFAPFLFNVILQGRYDSGLSVLPVTLVYCIWFSLMSVGQNYLWVAEKGKWAVLAIGLGLLINLSLNFALIPEMGLTGAVIATAIGNLAIVLMIFGINHHIGCKTDLGIWLSALVPIVLLAPTPIAIIAATGIAVLCWTTTIFFSTEEKSTVIKFAREKIASRLRRT